MVVTTNCHCKSVIISGTIFSSWDYFNHIVECFLTDSFRCVVGIRGQAVTQVK